MKYFEAIDEMEEEKTFVKNIFDVVDLICYVLCSIFLFLLSLGSILLSCRCQVMLGNLIVIHNLKFSQLGDCFS